MNGNGNGSNLALGYVRVSTDEQAREGVSLDMQREKIQQYAALHDLDLLCILQDGGYSATDTNRPALQLLIEATRGRKIGHIVTYKIDRLFRNLRDATVTMGAWQDQAVAFHSVSENLDLSTPMGRCVLGILLTLAQWESETIGERVRSTMRHAQANGRCVSGPRHAPYGYRAGPPPDPDHPNRRPLIPVPKEQAALKRMRLLRDSGASYGEICAALAKEGHPARCGKWRRTTVAKILARKEKP